MEMDAGQPANSAHYSGKNRVPNIQEFMAQLDKEKKERDAKIDDDLRRNKAQGDVKAHKNDTQPKAKNARSVRDPVTGKDVEIQDADVDFEEAIENPQV